MVIIEVGGEKGNKTFTAVVAMATKKVNVRWIEQGDKRREKNDKEIEYVKSGPTRMLDNYTCTCHVCMP